MNHDQNNLCKTLQVTTHLSHLSAMILGNSDHILENLGEAARWKDKEAEICSKMCNISSITSANHTPEKKKCASAHLKFFKSKQSLCLFFRVR